MTKSALDTAAGADQQSDALSALNEIDDAARLAFQAMEAEKADIALRGEQVADAKSKAVPVEPGMLSASEKNDRIKIQAKRAQNQREKGRAELTKSYTGAMTVEHKLRFNDLNIASSCERFLGICDQAPYVIGRRGPSVLGTVSTTKVLEQITEQVDKYYEAGKAALLEAETLFKVEHDKVMSEEDWVTPTYQNPAMDIVTQVKHRGTTRLITGMKAWDEAIRLANVLAWNDAIKEAEIANIRSAERKAFTQVFSLCNRSVIGLYRGTLKVENRSSQGATAANPEAAASGASAETAPETAETDEVATT